MPALPDHLPGIPELGTTGVPLRLRGLPRRADAAAGEHPRRDQAFGQGPPARPPQHPAADDLDPAPQRLEACRGGRRLRDGGADPRPDQVDRTRAGTLTTPSRMATP